jgi:hypothetical protein
MDLDIFRLDVEIDPIIIPPADIRKLERSPYGSGGLGDIWKCSMSAPSRTCIVSFQTDRKSVIYHNLGCCQVCQDPRIMRYRTDEQICQGRA